MSGNHSLFRTDFIFKKGLLRALLLCLHNTLYPNWIVQAQKFQNSIYLCEFYSDERVTKTANSTVFISSRPYGFKFMQHLTEDFSGRKEDSTVPVNESIQSRIMLTSKLNSHKLLYSADSEFRIERNTNDNVKLKTVQNCSNSTYLPPYKALDIWACCYTNGFQKALCGFRDRSWIVNKLKMYYKSDLIEIIQQKGWSVSECVNFCDDFFELVKEKVVKDGRNSYEFSFFKDERAIFVKELPGKSFLTEDFMENF